MVVSKGINESMNGRNDLHKDFWEYDENIMLWSMITAYVFGVVTGLIIFVAAVIVIYTIFKVIKYMGEEDANNETETFLE